MAEIRHLEGFTIYLDGHEGHRGNVLASAFLAKASKLIVVLNRLERSYIDARTRQTDFEIVGADKRNPTTLSLKPVPRVKGYDPSEVLRWSIHQIDLVGRGDVPDDRVDSDLAYDLHDLATKKGEFDYKAFWINGHAERVKFDEEFAENALRLAHARRVIESATSWKVGAALGSVVGELKKVDDLEAGQEFVIVPPVGPEQIVCTFPDGLRGRMGDFLFKTVKVEGVLHYGERSPFPYRVEASDITEIPKRRKSFGQMRGIFANRQPQELSWGSLIDGR